MTKYKKFTESLYKYNNKPFSEIGYKQDQNPQWIMTRVIKNTKNDINIKITNYVILKK